MAEHRQFLVVAMRVIQIDIIGAQAVERFVERAQDAGRFVQLLAAPHPGLGVDQHLSPDPARFEPQPDQRF